MKSLRSHIVARYLKLGKLAIPTWIIETMASHHLTNQKTKLQQLTEENLKRKETALN